MSPLVKHFVILFLFSQIDIITNKLSFASLLSRLSVYCLLSSTFLLFSCSFYAYGNKDERDVSSKQDSLLIGDSTPNDPVSKALSSKVCQFYNSCSCFC